MKKIRVLYIVLLSITGALAAILITGTIIGLARKSDTPFVTIGGSKASAQAVNTQIGPEDIKVFNGIGRLRIPLVNSSVLILSVAFPYPAQDSAFTEELAGKINEFKTITQDYFSSLPEKDIIIINEDEAKTEILNRFNSNLRLGRIQSLYFNDMMILDVNATY